VSSGFALRPWGIVRWEGGKAMLIDRRIRVDNLEERHDRRPYKQCGFPSWKLHAKIMEQTSEIPTTGRQTVPPIPAARVYDGCEA
jgi:hypothetical protein